jgi:hypothetical protein
VNTGTLTANMHCLSGGTVTTIYKDINRNGLVDLDTDKLMSSFITCNGVQGVQGLTGNNGANSILRVIDLRHDVCGLPSVNFEEVVIQLADGKYLSSFSDNFAGDNTRFTILVKGVTYSTTDGNNCLFKIDENNNLIKL